MKVFEYVLLLFLFLLVPLLAKSQVIAKEEIDLKVTVNHVAAGFEKFQEKIILLFKFSKGSKTEYLQFLSEKRLAELVYSLESNQIDLLEPTASRYTTYIGNLTNYMVANKVSSKKQDVTSMFERHIKVVKKLHEKVPQDSGWWIALQHDINAAADFKEKINRL